MSNIAVGILKGDYIWLDNRLLEMTFQKFDFNDTLRLPVGTQSVPAGEKIFSLI